MKKWLVLSAVVAGLSLLAPPRAAASDYPKPPFYTSALFTCPSSGGWQTGLWWHHWHYPWYAYYNHSHGPYANWAAGGGYATYANCGPGGCAPGAAAWGGHAHAGHHAAVPVEGTIAVTLPADAKLLFNGHAAVGTGETRSFRTPPLQPGQSYTYQLTAEVVRDGRVQTATEKVVVKAGEKTSVTLTVEGVRTASK
jgi:uncharacterized protein (TIGR03000 family)